MKPKFFTSALIFTAVAATTFTYGRSWFPEAYAKIAVQNDLPMSKNMKVSYPLHALAKETEKLQTGRKDLGKTRAAAAAERDRISKNVDKVKQQLESAEKWLSEAKKIYNEHPGSSVRFHFGGKVYPTKQSFLVQTATLVEEQKLLKKTLGILTGALAKADETIALLTATASNSAYNIAILKSKTSNMRYNNLIDSISLPDIEEILSNAGIEKETTAIDTLIRTSVELDAGGPEETKPSPAIQKLTENAIRYLEG